MPGIIEKGQGSQQPSSKAHQCGQPDREGVRQHWGGRKRGEQKNQNPKRMRKGDERGSAASSDREPGPRSAPSSLLLLCQRAHGRVWVSKRDPASDTYTCGYTRTHAESLPSLCYFLSFSLCWLMVYSIDFMTHHALSHRARGPRPEVCHSAPAARPCAPGWGRRAPLLWLLWRRTEVCPWRAQRRVPYSEHLSS